MLHEHNATMTWAVVTPVFEDGQSFAELCRNLSRVDADLRLEILAVDDGSVNDPPTLHAIEQAGLRGRVIRLRRNVGHQMAISVGLAQAASEPRYAGVVVMDCDGEDKPQDIVRLVRAVRTNPDVAVATRGRRTESLTFRVFYQLYRCLFGLLTGRKIDFGNFCAVGPRGLSRLVAMQESRLHLAAAVIKSRLYMVEIPIDRGKRYCGRSRMNFYSLTLHGIRAVAVFDDAVLTRMGVVCVSAAVLGAAIFATAAILKLIGEATPGWLTFVTGFLILVFLQTAVLSLVALILNGLTYRSPAQIDSDTASLVLETEIAGCERHGHA